MPADKKPLPKAMAEKRTWMPETFELATERHRGKVAPIKAFLPVPILNLRRGLAHNLLCDFHGLERQAAKHAA